MVLLIIKTFISLLAFESLALGNHQKESWKVRDPPCFFNPLCICSKAYPDLGRVTCKDIPLLRVPRQINMSKVFTLHLENNGLRYIEPHFFRQTGLFRISITGNLLTEISEEAFAGLERSLWELNLQRNRFNKVPNQSFRYLQKLKTLDLSDNEITTVKSEDWLGLEDSLKTLILSGNRLSSIRPRAFSVLQQLESLDLRGNAIYEFDGLAFKDGPTSLSELLLTDNLLSSIPIQELSELRGLRHLDLSFNLITEIQDPSFDRNKKKPPNLLLDTLRLDYNQIQYLPFEAFKNFPTLNKTFLNGNPISYIEKNAFQRTKIRQLYLKDCEISEMSTEAFSGLEDFLEVLDLEGNNITSMPLYSFKRYDLLKSLNLKDNFLKEIESDKMFGEFQPALQHLDVSGRYNSPINFKNLEKLRNLQSLTVSRLQQTSLTPVDIPEFLIELEDLKIFDSNIKSLKSHAFKNVRGLRRIDLSENSISSIESEAFAEVGHSLEHLSLANALSSSLTQLPENVFEDLTSIEFLDLSNNKLKVLPPKLFHSMKRLRTIRIHDNFIEFIPKRAFQEDIHSELNTIQFSFNQLSSIERQTFVALNRLENLWLSNNKIATIEKGAFMNLDKLKFLYLRGNNINNLKEESFQDLPELEKLDLAYNKLKSFNYNCLEQVGTLSSFILNVSHNVIQTLASNLSETDYPSFAVMHVNLKAFDASHNNITLIEPRFFKPIESSVTHLYLSNNKLVNLTRGVFGNMMHLQWLDLSYNFIETLEFDALFNTKSIQVLYLSKNLISEIPKQFFDNCRHLRLLDLKSNDLRSLPDGLFNDAVIEQLDLSDNQLTRTPVNCFDADSAAVLSELDLSDNMIVALPTAEAFAMFKSLHRLDLSKNRIIRIEDATFSHLTRLRELDLSHNAELTLDSKGQTFYGLYDTLEDLILKNLSLNAIPMLRFDFLRSLDVSDNQISKIPFEFSNNLPGVEKMELAGNKLEAIPPAINALTKLRYLGIARNPLESINFQQSFSLREIDLRNASLRAMEKGALGKLPLLENLKLTVSQNIQGLNLPYLLKDNYGLNHLFVEVAGNKGSSLGDEMSGSFSCKLRNLILVGNGLRTIPRNLLEGIKSSRLELIIFNTSVEGIDDEVFENAIKIRNLTLRVKSNKLKTMYNPNTGDYPDSSKKMFLEELEISDNDWVCDCSIGWIENWERKRRQYLCEEDNEDCFLISDDLRNAVCKTPTTKNIVDVFKMELECEWNASTNLRVSMFLEFFFVTIWLLNR